MNFFRVRSFDGKPGLSRSAHANNVDPVRMNYIKSYGFIVAHESVQKAKLDVQIYIKSYDCRDYSYNITYAMH